MRTFLAASIFLALAAAHGPVCADEPDTTASEAASASAATEASSANASKSATAAANAVEANLTGPNAAEVADVERAFAKTMADRDLEAFKSFLHPDTVWFSGPGGSALHGRDAVVAEWSKFYEGPDAPFAWAPDRVAVMDGGDLAMSMGPVFSPEGKEIARFTSVWRRGKDGRWLILFDKGEASAPRD
jgi:uncharacterized protein (TIGR02246 family)